jgi:hypothetical protein
VTTKEQMSASSLQYINKNIKTIGKSLMRINELLTEETLDELSLAQVGKGVGNVIRKTSSAVHGAKGAWHGAKDAWAQGKQTGHYDAARNIVGGGASATNPAQQQNQQAQTSSVPGQTNTDSTQTTANDQPAQTNQQQTTASTSNQQQTQQSSAMKADDITGGLKSVWDKATADQGSMTSSPQVQQQIIAMAKDAGLTGRKIESVGHSRFLGIDL